MSDLDLDAARSETVNEIAGCLYRLSRANHRLTLAQRVALAEIARDQGYVVSALNSRVTSLAKTVAG